MLGYIYKIIVNISNEIYIGSTFQELRHRWQDHKGDYQKYKNGYRKNSCSSFNLFTKYGIENCKIILIKEYNVCDRKHLEMYETLWINKLKSINSNSPFRINKLYYNNYYTRNKKRITERNQKYKEANEEKNKTYHAEYYQKNKELWLQSVECICGGKYVLMSKKRHEKSKKHQNYITNNNKE